MAQQPLQPAGPRRWRLEVRELGVYIDVWNFGPGGNIRQIPHSQLADGHVGKHRRDVAAILKKIMRHLRPARRIEIALTAAAVKQIGSPDECVALARKEQL